ncbi:MAG: zinc-binding alcohol dehydrogenase family protein [Candidatus Korobacteraceae bacterium]
MRAWLMDSYDGVEKLRLDEVPDPQPGPGQAVIKTLYAALNPADAFLALAQYPAKPTLPHVLGRDGVGEVVALGEGVANVKPGDIVGILRGHTGVESWGTLAEKTAVDSANLIPLPQGWSQQELAGAPLVFLTAWQALTQWSEPEAPPPAGSVALITGASGGVGSAAVLLARSMGLTVVALSRSAPKAEQLKQLGADFVFDPTEKNVRKLILSATAPKRVDIVVDTVAGPLFNELIATLGYAGRISVVGRSGGAVPEFNTATLFFRRNRIGGVAVADFSVPHAQATWSEIVTRLDKLGKRPVVDGVFSFTNVKAAFARLGQGPMGKILVKVAN